MKDQINWVTASRAQLCEIAYNDVEAPLQHRIAAADELKRRNRKQYSRINFREKAVYR